MHSRNYKPRTNAFVHYSVKVVTGRALNYIPIHIYICIYLYIYSPPTAATQKEHTIFGGSAQ